MDKLYEPELGQFMFGQPPQSFKCDAYIEAALAMIREELDRVMYNITQNNYDNPFSNSGASFVCDTFEVHAYDWNEDNNQEFNFKWGSIKISWYKYLGRGMSINIDITPNVAATMLRECLDALKEYETNKYKV